MKPNMRVMGTVAVACAAALVMASAAEAASLQVSLGLRETDAGGGASVAVFDNGGSTGGIEWVDLDAQTLTLDGTWQQFTWNLSNPNTVTAFAGTTADGVLEGNYGTLEHLRFLIVDSVGPFDLYLDDVTAMGPTGGPVTFGWEGQVVGTEVMFQEPGFSGSTSGNLLPNPNVAAVAASPVHSGEGAYHVSYGYVDLDPTRWLRLTTFNSTVQPNPAILFSGELSIWIRGEVSAIPEPGSAMLLGTIVVGAAAIGRRSHQRTTT